MTTWMNAMTTWAGHNALSLAALILSLAALLLPALKGRKAAVRVRFAASPDCRGRADRMVLVNDGPAEARNINVTFTNNGGSPWEPVMRTDIDAPLLPLPVLAPGERFYMPISVVLGTGDYVIADMSWRDGRMKPQRARTTASLTGYPL